MSNVFSNTSFAVLSVMENHVDTAWIGATAFVQRKPEANYGNILSVSFPAADWNILDFNIQDRFNANIASNIIEQISTGATNDDKFVASNSNISVKSYTMTAVENTG